MKLFRFLLLVSVFFAMKVHAQNNLFVPNNIEKTYDTKTRSVTGNPGENYWQNRADYNISVKLFPQTRKVNGSEKIHYINNSPDTLKRIYFNVYQDFYKMGNMRDFPISPNDIHDGVIINNISVNGNAIENQDGFNTNRSILSVELPVPMLPGTEINVELSWEFTLPHISNVRYGSYNETSFMVAYWYPAIAVYDDIDGWNIHGFSGTQEFYNDFGNYEVAITVPDNFIVWATGELQNANDLLEPKALHLYNESMTSDNVIHIVEDDKGNKKILKKSTINTWIYKADNVSEFAFATSDHYLWDATSIIVDSSTMKRVHIQTAYLKDSKDFYQVADIARKSVQYFSFEMPAHPFPFPALSIFNGGGGMEFPMMVNDGSSERLAGTVHVTSHEICHSYLPFYMGINEQKYAWMDEGWAVMLPFKFQSREAEGYKPIDRLVKSYVHYAGNEQEVPPITLSSVLNGKTYYGTYRVASYARPALAYEYLRDMLGDEKFLAVMNEYFERWNSKHPMPFDFFNTFNNFLGEDMNWYWNPWFFENGIPDIAIKKVDFEDETTKITLQKVGNIPVPVKLNIIIDDATIISEYRTAKIWEDTNETVIEVKSFKKPFKIELDNTSIPDINVKNNTYKF